jgi:hypothetical protein
MGRAVLTPTAFGDPPQALRMRLRSLENIDLKLLTLEARIAATPIIGGELI